MQNNNQLTDGEKLFLEQVLKDWNNKRSINGFSFFISKIIVVFGLLLFVVGTIVTFKNFNDRIIYLVFLPSMVGGIGIILLGIFLLKYFREIEEKRKVAKIIEKLLD